MGTTDFSFSDKLKTKPNKKSLPVLIKSQAGSDEHFWKRLASIDRKISQGKSRSALWLMCQDCMGSAEFLLAFPTPSIPLDTPDLTSPAQVQNAAHPTKASAKDPRLYGR